MSHNTGFMAEKAHHRKLLLILICITLVTLGIVSVVGLQMWERVTDGKTESQRATADVERELTAAHGDEVSEIIENFLLKWLSLVAIKNPSIQSELATKQYIEFARYDDALLDEPSWLVTKLVVVKSVRVLEYTPQQFKAIGCVIDYPERVTPEGALIKSLPPHEFRSIYVFVHEDERWKLAGQFNITNVEDALRDWDYAPEWLRQIIGDLHSEIDKDCKINS